MKYAIIIPDGAAGEPLEGLDGQTALQVAKLPALDALAVQGRLGTTCVAEGSGPATEAATHLSALGYAPERYPAGEGALTACARNLDLDPSDQAFCCSLVTVIDGFMRDFTAGFISTAEAAPLLDVLNQSFGSERFGFQACGGHRNLCVWKGAGPLPRLRTTPPDQILNQPIKRHMPRGNGSRPLYQLMLRSDALLREHDINLVRQDLGENPATTAWLWGHGPLPMVPSFQQRYGVRGALVGKADVVRGIGRLIGWEVLEVAGATGLPDTDYAAKGRAAAEALDSFDLVCVHVQAARTLGMLGHVARKLEALEAIDRHIVAPLIARLQKEAGWRVLVLAARADGATHQAESVGRTMVVMTGSGIRSNRGEAFDEEDAADGELHPARAHDLMEYFLRR